VTNQVLQPYKTAGKIIHCSFKFIISFMNLSFLKSFVFPTNRLRGTSGHSSILQQVSLMPLLFRPISECICGGRPATSGVSGQSRHHFRWQCSLCEYKGTVCMHDSHHIPVLSVHPNLSRTEVFNAWIFKPTSPIRLHGVLLRHNFNKCNTLQLGLMLIFWKPLFFLSTSRQILGQQLKRTTAVSFHILPNSSFTVMLWNSSVPRDEWWYSTSTLWSRSSSE
jgi:hypothetical protein